MNAMEMMFHSLHHQQTALQVSICPICYQEVDYLGDGVYACPARHPDYPVTGYRSIPCPFPHLHT